MPKNFDDKQDVVRRQPSPTPHLNRKEVGSHQRLPIRLQEHRPRHSLTAYGGRLDPVIYQDPTNRPSAQHMAKVRHRSLDARLASTGVFACHPHHWRSEFLAGPGPAWSATLNESPLARHQLAVSAKEGFGRDYF